MNPRLHEIAESIKSYPREASGHIYHPLPFPEFRHLETSSNETSAYRKWKLIRQCLPLNSSLRIPRVLDVGANAGFYAFNFAKLGATVEAYEPDESYATTGREIARATGLSVRWFNKPLDQSDVVDQCYDVALMLSVFQWISQGNSQLEQATDLLRSVASCSRFLFFELGCNHGKGAICTTERPLGWVWRLLQQNTSPMQVSYLGSTTPWGRGRRYLFACAEDPIQLTIWQRSITHALRQRWLW